MHHDYTAHLGGRVMNHMLNHEETTRKQARPAIPRVLEAGTAIVEKCFFAGKTAEFVRIESKKDILATLMAIAKVYGFFSSLVLPGLANH